MTNYTITQIDGQRTFTGSLLDAKFWHAKLIGQEIKIVSNEDGNYFIRAGEHTIDTVYDSEAEALEALEEHAFEEIQADNNFEIEAV